MNCKCGYGLKENFKFCPICGEIVPKPIPEVREPNIVKNEERKFTVKTALTDYFQGTLGEARLRRAIRDGEIPHFRVGSRIIFSEAALNAWVAELEQASVSNNRKIR